VQEITGMEGDMITMQEIFSFKQTTIDSEGKVKGNFRFHGVRPRFMDRFKAAGIEVPNNLFDPSNFLEI
jgi:pilus assembly protein CpaF